LEETKNPKKKKSRKKLRQQERGDSSIKEFFRKGKKKNKGSQRGRETHLVVGKEGGPGPLQPDREEKEKKRQGEGAAITFRGGESC